jgi:hypothetical protein
MKRHIVTLIIITFITSSCSRLLDQKPENALTTEQIKEILESGDTTKIDLIIGGIANNLPYAIHKPLGAGGSDARLNSPLRLQYYNCLTGYDIVAGEGAGGFGAEAYQAYTSRRGAANNYHNYAFWRFGWSCVVAANKLLYYMPDNISNSKLMDYKARALTVRAFGYNFLMENYRDAYSPSADGLMIYDKMGADGGYKPIVTSAETYDFIKRDLREAIRLFAESKIGEHADGYTSDTKDIDLAVANFVMARATLLTGDYAATIDACNDILAHYPDLISVDYYGGKNTGTSTKPEFIAETNAFLKIVNNPEVIFGFTGVPTYENATTAWLNIFGDDHGGSGANWARIVNTLYDDIHPNDIRKRIFLDGQSSFTTYEYPTTPPIAMTIPSYSNLKYAANDVGGKTSPNDLKNIDLCYMRSSEVLLMKAEAQVRNNDLTGAKSTINTLLAARTFVGTPLTCDNYGGADNIFDMVKLQWRIEMWGENGLEYYNNKRWGNVVVRSASTNHWNRATIGLEMMTLELPSDELIFNPNLQ